MIVEDTKDLVETADFVGPGDFLCPYFPKGSPQTRQSVRL